MNVPIHAELASGTFLLASAVAFRTKSLTDSLTPSFSNFLLNFVRNFIICESATDVTLETCYAQQYNVRPLT